MKYKAMRPLQMGSQHASLLLNHVKDRVVDMLPEETPRKTASRPSAN